MLFSRARHRRVGRSRRLIAVGTLCAVVLSLVGAAPTHAATPAGSVVLDPDNNLSFSTWDGGRQTELPITYQIAVQAKAKLLALCDTSVVITRDASQNSVSPETRAVPMQNATVSMTLSLNNLTGAPWGDPAGLLGGSIAYIKSTPNNTNFATNTLNAVNKFTRRPTNAINLDGSVVPLPYDAFAKLPGTYVQAFLLFMDNEFDWPAINGVWDGLQYGYLTDAVVTAVGQQLQAQGVSCGNTAGGQAAFPATPSAAQLAALFALGFANYTRFGADPVNFATGNFLEPVDLFTVSGPGGADTPVSLTYNAMDSRAGRFGVGWSSGLDGRSQTYADNSVLITGPDGSATSYTKSATGYTQPAGTYANLTRPAAHVLVVTQPDSSTQTYTEDPVSGAGVLTAQTDRSGHTGTYTYAQRIVILPNPWPVAPDGSSAGTGATYVTNGALASMTAPGAQTVMFGSDAAGRVSSVTRPDGAAWAMTYDSVGNLTAITDANLHATRYTYDSLHRMVTVTDPAGITYLTNTYDAQGRVASQKNGTGAVDTIAYVYDKADHVVQTIDPTNAVTNSTYDLAGNKTSTTDPTGRTATTAYDVLNRVSASTDAAGATTKYAYNAAGQLAQTTDPVGRVNTFTYTADGHAATATDPNSASTKWAYDPDGNVTAVTDPRGGAVGFAYTAKNQLKTKTDATGNATGYGYDLAGQESSVTDPTGVVTAYTHDVRGLLTSVVQNAVTGQATSASVNVTSTYGYDADGRLVTTTDPLGGTRSYGYNLNGDLTKATDPLGAITNYAYDLAGNLTHEVDGVGNSTTLAYDKDGRPTLITPPTGQHTIQYLYDQSGRMTKMIDGSGTSLSTSSWTYDQAGRVSTAVDSHSLKLSYTYDASGLRTSMTYPDATVASYTRDPGGRITGLTTSGGSAGAAGTITYGYDPDGDVTSIKRPNSTNSSYTYDPNNHITNITHTGPAGLLPGSADATPLNPEPANPTPTATTPTAGTSTAAKTAAQQPAVASPAPATPSDPSAAVHTSSVLTATAVAAAATPLTCTSTVAGCTATTKTAVAPLPLKLDYSYDKDGRVASQKQTSGNGTTAATLTTTYGYDPLNRLTSSTRTDGQNATYTYDAAGDRTAVATTDPVTTAILATSATFNKANELITQVTTGTLTAAGATHTSTATIKNTYDANGNLTAATTTHTASDSAALTAFLGTVLGNLYGLDNNGPQTTTYKYDYANRVTTITAPDPTSTPADPVADRTMTSSFLYDGLGRAVTQTLAEPHHTDRLLQLDVKLGLASATSTVGIDTTTGKACTSPTAATCRSTLTPFAGDLTNVTYDGQAPVAWTDASTASVNINRGRTLDIIRGPEGTAEQTDSRFGTTYFHLDNLGSPRVLSGKSGVTVAQSAYDDWGNSQPQPGQHQSGGLLPGLVDAAGTLLGSLLGLTPTIVSTDTSAVTPIGYTNQLANPVLGLVQFNARTLDPAKAAWIQCDPHTGTPAEPQRLNRYTYVNNNPTNMIDPNGADPVPQGCGSDPRGCGDFDYTGICDYGTTYCLDHNLQGIQIASSLQDCRQQPFLINCVPGSGVDPTYGVVFDPSHKSAGPAPGVSGCGSPTRAGCARPPAKAQETPAQRQARYFQQRHPVSGRAPVGPQIFQSSCPGAFERCEPKAAPGYRTLGSPTSNDRFTANELAAYAVTALGLGYEYGSGFLLHFLSGAGSDLALSSGAVDGLLGVPEVQLAVANELIYRLDHPDLSDEDAWNVVVIGVTDGGQSKDQQVGGTTVERDWHLALGSADIRVVNVAQISTGVTYQVQVRKYYDFNGKPFDPAGPANFSADDLNRLTGVGLAQSFYITGTSSTWVVPN